MKIKWTEVLHYPGYKLFFVIVSTYKNVFYLQFKVHPLLCILKWEPFLGKWGGLLLILDSKYIFFKQNYSLWDISTPCLQYGCIFLDYWRHTAVLSICLRLISDSKYIFFKQNKCIKIGNPVTYHRWVLLLTYFHLI